MTTLTRPPVVILGMLSKIPVGGVAWLVGQYAEGFDRLGFESYYVEAHSRTPSMFMEHEGDDNIGRAFDRAARFVGSTMDSFGLRGRWALHSVHDVDRSYGLSRSATARLYRDAALIINLHGGTIPLPEHSASGRLVYLGTDPVDVELELDQGDQRAIEFMAAHAAHFTWALNYGNPDCKLPWSEAFPMMPSPPPVITDRWSNNGPPAGAPYTTIGNWRQEWRDLTFRGDVYRWSKHHEFLKILDLPSLVDPPIELALGHYTEDDRALLERNGWRVRPADALSRDTSSYRAYIQASRGELTVAKDQNVRLRTGWFSERSATYLASGRPVVTQDTGFGSALPTGEGLFAFNSGEEAADAIRVIESDYEHHRRAALEIAHDYFAHDVVLGALLDHMGLRPPNGSPRRRPSSRTMDLPLSLRLTPVSRRPLVLPTETVDAVCVRPIPSLSVLGGPLQASIVVVTLDNLVLTRMALESVLVNTADVPHELIVVDNGSDAATRQYLSVLAAKNTHVRVILNDTNRGFAAANNQGLAIVRGEVVVLLNNDTIVPPGWLVDLVGHLRDPSIGLVGPVTNRCGNEAEVPTSYETYGEMVAFAGERRHGALGEVSDIPVTTMFCVALRCATLEAVGPLDERYEIGMFEDDDYALRVRQMGERVVCAEDVFVHHFGEGSLGSLAAAGAYGELFAANRRRFEQKWAVEWHPHRRRSDPAYDGLRRRLSKMIADNIPRNSTVLVVTKGDDLLLELPGYEGWHFPRAADGGYAGYHPVDDADVIDQLEGLRGHGATYLVIPAPALWWLDHYGGLSKHLEERYRHITTEPTTAAIYDLGAIHEG
jgi:GT2 family glycosyltransferase